jgi:hypothetical protein
LTPYRIDELFTAWPFFGSRRMTAMLRATAPIAEHVPIGGDRHGRVGGQIVGRDDVGRPGEMASQDLIIGVGCGQS